VARVVKKEGGHGDPPLRDELVCAKPITEAQYGLGKRASVGVAAHYSIRYFDFDAHVFDARGEAAVNFIYYDAVNYPGVEVCDAHGRDFVAQRAQHVGGGAFERGTADDGADGYLGRRGPLQETGHAGDRSEERRV